MRIAFFFSLFLVFLSVFPQQGYLYLERDFSLPYERFASQTEFEIHSSVKPFLVSDLNRWMDTDSIHNTENIWDYFIKQKKDSFLDLGAKFIRIDADLLFNFQPGHEIYDNGNNTFLGAAIGGGMQVEISPKFFMAANYWVANSSFPTYLSSYIFENKIVPGQGYAFNTQVGYYHENFSGYMSYSPDSVFNFQLGHGKNFWGDGYRSLLLSDAANNYSYFKITTNIWKLKYVNLFCNFKDVRQTNGLYWDFPDKYGTFHYLSWNMAKWLNVSFFESVIWGGKDVNNTRNFDVNYLNPVIFYRPVEFSTGSADNSLMGLNVKIKPISKFQIYGQVLIDEFLLDSLKSRNGWWANKHGAQIGFRWFDVFGLEGVSWQSEFNYMRPYTYSHQRALENYGHFNQPLAHPLGANFKEGLSILTWQRKKWTVEWKSIYAEFGTDSSGINFGSDIYQPYTTVQAVTGNYTGQGMKTTLFYNELRGSYLVFPKSNLKAEIGAAWRQRTSSKENESNLFFWFGIKTALGNFYGDFL